MDAPTPAPANAQPKWLRVAWGEANVAEVPGHGDNPRILQYLRSTTLASQQWHDETPWCSAFVNWCMRESNIHGTNLANARSWLTWDRELLVPKLGCVVVFSAYARGMLAGHVGFYVGETPQAISVLGGNQFNRVCVQARDRTQLLCYRWPWQTG
jgi:uncharacterized protein (TIGR02594 family)